MGASRAALADLPSAAESGSLERLADLAVERLGPCLSASLSDRAASLLIVNRVRTD